MNKLFWAVFVVQKGDILSVQRREPKRKAFKS